MDIIFHIGFPKCASTTLQNEVFKNEVGYLGTYKGLATTENYAKQFQSIAPIGPGSWGSLKLAKNWTKKVLRRTESQMPEVRRFIVSSELLTNRNKFNNRPIINFLKKFKDEVWTSGKVKVLIVIRNPPERLASGYAQMSNIKSNASQNDFEQYITCQLKSRNLMRYDLWVKDLYTLLGKENVCVLLMEEIGLPIFWQEIKDFCQLQNFDPKQWLVNATFKNTRRWDESSWQLQPYDPAYKAKIISNKIFGLLWPSYVGSELRIKTQSAFQQFATNFYRKGHVTSAGEDRGIIRLMSQDRLKIQQAYSSQTKNLSRLLQKDMQALGY